MKEEVVIKILPIEGTIIKQCSLCPHPMLDDGTLDNCVWCEIHKGYKKKPIKAPPCAATA